jgi:hypothetical protein
MGMRQWCDGGLGSQGSTDNDTRPRPVKSTSSGAVPGALSLRFGHGFNGTSSAHTKQRVLAYQTHQMTQNLFDQTYML